MQRQCKQSVGGTRINATGGLHPPYASFIPMKALLRLGIPIALAASLMPIRTVTVPEWRAQFVDATGKPFKSLPVEQTWQNYSIESSAHYSSGVTDNEGFVIFPERTVRAPIILRIVGPIGSVLFRGGVHASFGPTSWLVVMCDMLPTDRLAIYAGADLPNKFTLKFFDRAPARNSTGMPHNDQCKGPDEQARQAGA
jgi:hypothetical protein